MPGLNRTGPVGNGPMTGGGRGLCNSAANQGFGISSDFRRGMGSGRRFRSGTGIGRRRGLDIDAFGNQPVYGKNTADELNILKSEAKSVKSMLETINKKIVELENIL